MRPDGVPAESALLTNHPANHPVDQPADGAVNGTECADGCTPGTPSQFDELLGALGVTSLAPASDRAYLIERPGIAFRDEAAAAAHLLDAGRVADLLRDDTQATSVASAADVAALDRSVARHPAGKRLDPKQAALIAARSVCPTCDGRDAGEGEEAYATCAFCASGTAKPAAPIIDLEAARVRRATRSRSRRTSPVRGSGPAASWGEDQPLLPT